MEGGLVVAIGRHLLEIGVPRFAWIDPELLIGLARQQIPRASDVRGGERLAVMPLTPWRNEKVSSAPSSFHDQLVARSGTIDCRLACGTSCWYMTRLLKTCIIGCSAARVDSSRIDMLAGLSKCENLRIPPLFCAAAGPAVAITIIRPAGILRLRAIPAIDLFPPAHARPIGSASVG